MSIEFRCAGCGQLLRVPDEAMGKVARCPACQTEQPVLPPVQVEAQSQEDNPYAPPLTLPRPEAAAAPVGLQPVVPSPLDVGKCFSAAWNIYLANVGMCIAVYLAGEFISSAPGLLVQFFVAIAQQAGDKAALSVALLVVPLALAGVVLTLWLTAGRISFFVKTARGLMPEFVELFKGWRSVGRLFLLGLLLAVVMFATFAVAAIVAAALSAAGANELSVVALVALVGASIVTYMYLLLRYGMSVFLVVDRDLPLGEALRTSGQITRGNLLSLLLLGLASSGLVLLGYLACCLGVFFTMPLILMMFTVAYLQMSGQSLTSSAMRG